MNLKDYDQLKLYSTAFRILAEDYTRVCNIHYSGWRQGKRTEDEVISEYLSLGAQEIEDEYKALGIR